MTNGAFSGNLTRWAIALPIILLGVVVVSTIGYCLIEDQTASDALYITVNKISTVGSREIPNMSPVGQWWTIGVVVVGVILAAATLSVAIALLTEGTLHKVLGRKQVQKAIDRLTGHVVICGFGRMGAMVADSLREAGRGVVIVEINADLFERPENANVLHVIGDAQDETTLTAAGVGRATHVVACLPDDADNVFLTLTAREMNSSLKIISRAEQPTTANKLRHAGADRVISPQTIGATRVANVILRPAVVDFVEVANTGVDLELDQLVVSKTSKLAGKTLRELALPARTGAIMVAMRKGAETIYNPGPDILIGAGDTLILVGQKGSAEKVGKLQPEQNGSQSAY